MGSIGRENIVLTEEQMETLSRMGLNTSDASESFGGYRRYTMIELDLKVRELMYYSNIKEIIVSCGERLLTHLQFVLGDKVQTEEKQIHIKTLWVYLPLELYYNTLSHLLVSWHDGDIEFDERVFNKFNLLKK